MPSKEAAVRAESAIDATATPSRSWCRGCRRVPLEVRDDLVARQESVRVGAVVGEPRELQAPVRRDEAEAVPAVTPRLTDTAALEDEMVDPKCRQLVADGEPCLAAADDGDADVLGPRHGRSLRPELASAQRRS